MSGTTMTVRSCPRCGQRVRLPVGKGPLNVTCPSCQIKWTFEDTPSRDDEPDYYELLQVSTNADIEVIEAAYRRLALKYHPDRNPGDPDAQRIMRRINTAKEVLSDSERRAAYDESRRVVLESEAYNDTHREGQEGSGRDSSRGYPHRHPFTNPNPKCGPVTAKRYSGGRTHLTETEVYRVTGQTAIRSSQEAKTQLGWLSQEAKGTRRRLMIHFLALPVIAVRYLNVWASTGVVIADAIILAGILSFPLALIVLAVVQAAPLVTALVTLFSFGLCFACATIILRERLHEKEEGRVVVRRKEWGSFFPTMWALFGRHSQLRKQIKRVRNIKDCLLRAELRLDELEELLDTDINRLTYIEFEFFLRDVFLALGYRRVIRTRTSGDQGVDLIVESDNDRIAIQAKHYRRNVGNDAVQQAVAGMAFYGCDRCAVITNSRFTESARQLAIANGCELITGVRLRRIIAGIERL